MKTITLDAVDVDTLKKCLQLCLDLALSIDSPDETTISRIGNILDKL